MKEGIYLGYKVNNKDAKNAIEFEGNFYLIEKTDERFNSFSDARKHRNTNNSQNCWIISIIHDGSVVCVENAFK